MSLSRIHFSASTFVQQTPALLIFVVLYTLICFQISNFFWFFSLNLNCLLFSFVSSCFFSVNRDSTKINVWRQAITKSAKMKNVKLFLKFHWPGNTKIMLSLLRVMFLLLRKFYFAQRFAQLMQGANNAPLRKQNASNKHKLLFKFYLWAESVSIVSDASTPFNGGKWELMHYVH